MIFQSYRDRSSEDYKTYILFIGTEYHQTIVQMKTTRRTNEFVRYSVRLSVERFIIELPTIRDRDDSGPFY
jgi:hypothetical protein